MALQNILVVGLVRVAHEADAITNALMRDWSRIRDLQRRFNTIFSMAPDTAGKPINEQHHVPHSLSKQGANALISLMNRHHPAGKLIHRVCIEYVRLPSQYYRPFIIGSSQTSTNQAGKILTDFMTTLNNHQKLARGCVLQFARHPSDDRWPAAIVNYESVFGKIEYVTGERNPLYIAGERTQDRLNEIMSHPYDHQRELHERTKAKASSPRLTHPFVQFTFPTQRFRQQFVAPRPLITGSPSTGSPSTTTMTAVSTGDTHSPSVNTTTPSPTTMVTASTPTTPVTTTTISTVSVSTTTPEITPVVVVTPSTPATPVVSTVPLLSPLFDVSDFDFDTSSVPSADPDPSPNVTGLQSTTGAIVHMQEARAEVESDMGAMIDEFRSLMAMTDDDDDGDNNLDDVDGVRQRDVHTDSDRSWAMTEDEIVEEVAQ